MCIENVQEIVHEDFFYSEILNTSHFPTVIQQYVHTYILHLKVICEF